MMTSTHNRGATLLIAVLLTSVVLAVGIGIYERTYKSLILSSYWKETQEAFAAADAGLECAFYLHNHSAAPATCFGTASFDVAQAEQSSGQNLDTPEGTCVNIRRIMVSGTLSAIEARGYNDACSSSNPRRVERGLKIEF